MKENHSLITLGINYQKSRVYGQSAAMASLTLFLCHLDAIHGSSIVVCLSSIGILCASVCTLTKMKS